MINAEPLISVRLRGGTPEKAVALMHYTRQQGYAVRYWSIGNEPSLYAPRNAEWDTAYYNVEWRKFAQAMQAVDPDIIWLARTRISSWASQALIQKDKEGRDWLREFLKANAIWWMSSRCIATPSRCRWASAHAQPVVRRHAAWETLAANLRQAVRQETGRDLPIAITESTRAGRARLAARQGWTPSTTRCGWATCWGRLIRQRVDVLAHLAYRAAPNVGALVCSSVSDSPDILHLSVYKGFGDKLVFAASDVPSFRFMPRTQTMRSRSSSLT